MGDMYKTTVRQIDSHAKVLDTNPLVICSFLFRWHYLSDDGRAQGEGWFAYCSAAKTDL